MTVHISNKSSKESNAFIFDSTRLKIQHILFLQDQLVSICIQAVSQYVLAGGRILLASTGGQPGESAEELGASVADSKLGGGGQEGVGKKFQGVGAGTVAVWGGAMGNYPEDRAGPGEFPAWGRALDHRKTTAEKGGQALDISSSEGGHERGRV